MEIISNILNFILSIISTKQFYGPIFTIVGAYIVYHLGVYIFSKIIIKGKTELDKKRYTTIILLVKNIFKYIVYIIVILIILEIYGVDTATLIAGLGIVGLVIGFALQDTLKDFVAGISMIMDNYYVVGDMVEYNGFKGEVLSLGLRSTKIKRYTGEIMVFANRNVLEIINYSQKKPVVEIELKVSAAEKTTDVEKVIKTLLPKISKIEDVVKDGAEYLGVSEVNHISATYLILVTCKRTSEYEVKRKINKLIKAEFENKKIKVPYPQVEVRNGKRI